MRIEMPRDAERFGANLIYGVQKVYELDAGPSLEECPSDDRLIRFLACDRLYEIERKMAVVVPVCGERIKLIEGALAAIPNHCLVIVVSNSPREPVDRFAMEERAITAYAGLTDKDVIVVHQKDPLLAEACAAAGYPELLDEHDLIRDGKGEGMMLATLLARLAGRKHIGFIDADNYFPGAVLEYIRAYAAGFALSNTPYTMVRICWHSKPKIMEDGLFFAKWGRTSRVTNRFLNRLISHYTGFETEVIRTGNAGEHAMSMALAMHLNYSTGYSIEPHHFIDMLEKFGGVVESPYPEVMRDQVETFQIESRNPHLHEAKDEEHIVHMIHAALEVIFHSVLCPDSLRADIVQELRARHAIGPDQLPRQGVRYPALRKVNLPAFLRAIRNEPFAELLNAPPIHAVPVLPETVADGV